jgi:hypothetical protein
LFGEAKRYGFLPTEDKILRHVKAMRVESATRRGGRFQCPLAAAVARTTG